jgi:5-methylcytosine-specific restriction endonuclease McrA
MPAKFHGIKKYCLVCKKELKLNNIRDIKRKRFCSQKCMGFYVGKERVKKNPGFYKELIRKCNTPEANAKKSHKGKNHPLWIEDKSKLKHREHSTIRVKLWRLDVFERDEFICQRCNKKGGKLQAHHIKSWAKYPDVRFDVNNGITLCIKCHKIIHKWKTRKAG